MKPSSAAIDLIKTCESFRPVAYQDSGGVWTIGYGSIMYKNAVRVQPGDTITEADATDTLMWDLNLKTIVVSALTQMVMLTQNQFDALCCFTYNVGVGAFASSTLLREIKINPNDYDIRTQFMRWNKVKGVVVAGLTNRRKKEADLYFS